MAEKKKGKKDWSRKELERIRGIAEDLYINKGYTMTQIAGTWDISEVTLSRWKKGREGEKSWDERKLFIQLTPVKLKEMLFAEALKIANGEPSTMKHDALSKIMASIEQIDKSINPRIVQSVFISFDNWLANIEPAKAAEMTKYHRQFIIHCTMQEHGN